MGLDSDHELATGEVGKVGVAIDTLTDMERVFAGIPLDRVSTSFTINATAPILLAMYQVVGEQQGVEPASWGHRAERHPQGVPRPQDLHLPASHRRSGSSPT